MGLWIWTVLPLLVLHLWMWFRHRELFRYQLVLDIVLAAVVGPALVLGTELGAARCLSRNRPFTGWQWSERSSYQPTQSDLVLLIKPGMEESRRQLTAGRLPLISERIGGGLPLLANGQNGVFAPVNLPVWLLGVERGTTVMAFWKLELAALGGFLFLARGLRLRWSAAAVGATAAGCGAYQVAWLLVPLGWVAAALPWMWWATLVALRGRPRAMPILGLGVAGGVLVGCGLNLQTAAIVFGSAAMLGLILHPRKWRRMAVATALAVLLAVVLAWPTLIYIGGSSRLELQRTERPNLARPPAMLRLQAAQQMLVPMIQGHPAIGEWRLGYPYAAAATGVGGLALVLLAAGGVRRRYRKLLWAALAQLAVAAILAYRVPPLDALLVRLPPFDGMTLSRFMVLVPWALALWAALAVDGVLSDRRRPGPWTWAVVAGLAGVALLGAPWRLLGLETALVVLTVAAGCSAVFLLRRPALLAPAVAVELALYALGINPTVTLSDSLPRPPLVERLVDLHQGAGGRVIGLGGVFPANLAARYGLVDLRAYDAVRPQPYVRMLRELGDPDPALGGPLSRAPAGLCGAWSVRFMMTPPGAEAEGWNHEWRDATGSIWSNPDWLPVLRVVGHTVAVEEDQGWRLLVEDAIDHRTSAVVPEGTPRADAEHIGLDEVESTPSSLSVRVACDGPCLVVWARPWAPGWRAEVDGDPAPVVRANLAGLGVSVPAGTHEVTLEYRAWW